MLTKLVSLFTTLNVPSMFLRILVPGGLVVAILLAYLMVYTSALSKQYQRGYDAGVSACQNQQTADASSAQLRAAEERRKLQGERDDLRVLLARKDIEINDAVQKALSQLEKEDPNVTQCLALRWPDNVRRHVARM